MVTEEDIRKEYVNAHEAAAIIGVNNSRIRQICIEGRFQGAFKVGETWLIPRNTVENYTKKKTGPKIRIKKSASDRAIIQSALKELKKSV